MPLDFKFDPVTKNLISDGKGSYVRTPHADTMVMHQLLCHYGKSFHDGRLGSRLHDLTFLQNRPEITGPEEAKRALNVLAARGRIANVEAIAKVPRPGRVDIATKFRDTSTGALRSVPAKVGG